MQWQKSTKGRRYEITSDIESIRAIEDAIRATGKYTKMIWSRNGHSDIQGDDFASKVVTENYEVYPELDITEQRPLWEALLSTSDWLWGDIERIEVRFRYNYTRNRAIAQVRGGNGVLKTLSNGIPGWEAACQNTGQ